MLGSVLKMLYTSPAIFAFQLKYSVHNSIEFKKNLTLISRT